MGSGSGSGSGGGVLSLIAGGDWLCISDDLCDGGVSLKVELSRVDGVLFWLGQVFSLSASSSSSCPIRNLSFLWAVALVHGFYKAYSFISSHLHISYRRQLNILACFEKRSFV